jgi:F-type H+-transporting ATPase subunit epsilon
MALHVDLVSPERILYSGEAEMVIARTVGGGDIAFLPGHAPFVGALEVAPVTIRPTGGAPDEVAAVHGGFVEVSDNHVTILSDLAELASQIDVERARQAQDQAEQRMQHDHDAEAEGAARRAHVRLAAAGGFAAVH